MMFSDFEAAEKESDKEAFSVTCREQTGCSSLPSVMIKATSHVRIKGKQGSLQGRRCCAIFEVKTDSLGSHLMEVDHIFNSPDSFHES